MDDLTSGFKMYRECARLVWKCFLRYYPDGEHEFDDVSSALCNALLISQIARYADPKSIAGREYHEAMNIVPADDGPIGVLCGFDGDGVCEWRAYRWSAEMAPLRFHDVFDFGTLSGEWREFKYTEAIVTEDGAPPFERGRRVLLESEAIRLVDISETPY